MAEIWSSSCIELQAGPVLIQAGCMQCSMVGMFLMAGSGYRRQCTLGQPVSELVNFSHWPRANYNL